jgi:alpha-glucosidase
MLDVFRFWLERGVDGFRLDVFNAYFKHPQLRSNPVRFPLPVYGFLGQEHVNDCSRPEMHPLLAEIRALLDAYSTPGRERFAVGETFAGGAECAVDYVGPGRLHAAFNFEFLTAPWSAAALTRLVQRWEHLLGDRWPSYVLNNHDERRLATRLRALRVGPIFYAPRILRSENDARLKLAAALLLTLRGTPFLYYGEEIGMRDIPITRKQDVLDPVGRRLWPIYPGRDACRAPMQWDASPNAGFTPPGARPWLPLHPDAPTRNVAAQTADPRSLLSFYRALIAVRRASPALQGGMYQPVTFGTRYIMAYLRQTREQTVLVALNFSRRRQRLVLGGHLAGSGMRLLLSSHREQLPAMRRSMLPLEPYEAIVIELG